MLCAFVAVTVQVEPTSPVAVNVSDAIEQPAEPALDTEYTTSPVPEPPDEPSTTEVPYVTWLVVTVSALCVARVTDIVPFTNEMS